MPMQHFFAPRLQHGIQKTRSKRTELLFRVTAELICPSHYEIRIGRYEITSTFRVRAPTRLAPSDRFSGANELAKPRSIFVEPRAARALPNPCATVSPGRKLLVQNQLTLLRAAQSVGLFAMFDKDLALAAEQVFRAQDARSDRCRLVGSRRFGALAVVVFSHRNFDWYKSIQFKNQGTTMTSTSSILPTDMSAPPTEINSPSPNGSMR